MTRRIVRSKAVDALTEPPKDYAVTGIEFATPFLETWRVQPPSVDLSKVRELIDSHVPERSRAVTWLLSSIRTVRPRPDEETERQAMVERHLSAPKNATTALPYLVLALRSGDIDQRGVAETTLALAIDQHHASPDGDDLGWMVAPLRSRLEELAVISSAETIFVGDSLSIDRVVRCLALVKPTPDGALENWALALTQGDGRRVGLTLVVAWCASSRLFNYLVENFERFPGAASEACNHRRTIPLAHVAAVKELFERRRGTLRGCAALALAATGYEPAVKYLERGAEDRL